MSEEERILRLEPPSWAIALRIFYWDGENWVLVPEQLDSTKIEDLERAPRPEKEIRGRFERGIEKEFHCEYCEFEYRWAFPYLSEEKKVTNDE